MAALVRVLLLRSGMSALFFFFPRLDLKKVSFSLFDVWPDLLKDVGVKKKTCDEQTEEERLGNIRA